MIELLIALFVAFVALFLAFRLRAARREIRTLEQGAQLEEKEARESLASAVHDLRAPLATILGYQELLADGVFGSVDSEADEAIERIGEAADILLGRINELERGGRDADAATGA